MKLIHRYIFTELLKVFLIALFALTALFVVFGVVRGAVQQGLDPAQILLLAPLIIPGTLPYTVPATILLAVTVVYGRLSADSEITACKAAGISAFRLTIPALTLGLVLSVTMVMLSHRTIPQMNRQLKKSLIQNVEDTIYAQLRRDQMIKGNRKEMPYEMYVREVRDRTLIDVRIKRRDANGRYTQVLSAGRASMRFDLDENVVDVILDRPQMIEIESGQIQSSREEHIKIPLPSASEAPGRPRELTTAEIQQEKIILTKEAELELYRCVFGMSVAASSGRMRTMPVDDMHSVVRDIGRLRRFSRRLDCEGPLRNAISFGSLFFVMLGCPVAILLQRGDYLSAFISCFLPIIGIYYPLVMFGLNFSKEGLLPPNSVWVGNVILAIASFIFYRPVIKH